MRILSVKVGEPAVRLAPLRDTDVSANAYALANEDDGAVLAVEVHQRLDRDPAIVCEPPQSLAVLQRDLIGAEAGIGH